VKAGAQCSGGLAKLERVWGEAQQAQVREAFTRTNSPRANATWERVKPALDSYAATWNSAFTDACEATVKRHEQPESLMLARMSCLDDGLRSLSALVTIFTEVNAASLDKAAMAANKLPSISSCANVHALGGVVPPPTDPRIVERLEVLKDHVARSLALGISGRYTEAVEVAKAVIPEADQLAYRPVQAKVHLAYASSLEDIDEPRAAVEAARVAAAYADEGRDDITRAIALLQMVFFLSDRLGAPAAAAEVMPLARGVALRTGDLDIKARLLKYEGVLLHGQNKPNEALASHLQSAAIFEQLYGKHAHARAVEVFNAGLSALLADKLDTSLTLFTEARELYTRNLGPDHAYTAMVHGNLGDILYRSNRPAEAAVEFERSLATFERIGKADGVWHADILGRYARVQVDTGQLEEGLANLQRATRAFERLVGDKSTGYAYEVSGIGATLTQLRRYPEAQVHFQRALAAYEAAAGKDTTLSNGTFVDYSDLLLRRGEVKAARAHLQRVIAQLTKANAEPGTLRRALMLAGWAHLLEKDFAQATARLREAQALVAGPQSPVDAARTKGYLARALWAERASREEGRKLAEEALAHFRANPKVDPFLREDLERWAMAEKL
jgi:tetratricopeptide (TPR) repeat protein